MIVENINFLLKKYFYIKSSILILKEQSLKNIWNGDTFSELRCVNFKNNTNQLFSHRG